MGWIEKLHECDRPEAEPNSIWQCDDCSFIWISGHYSGWHGDYAQFNTYDIDHIFEYGKWYWKEPDEKDQRKIQRHLTAERNRHETLRKERLKNDEKLHRPSEDSRL